MKGVTIILPCAGEGKRLGAAGPKELFEIYPGKKLIDYSLEHIKAFNNSKKKSELDVGLSVIIVIKPGKESVFHHVSEMLPTINVNYVMFNNYFREWPGSVYSAGSEFSEMNIVLLPDTFVKFGSNDLIYTDGDGETLISKAVEKLNEEKVVFGVTKSLDHEMISSLGAVRVDKDRIVKFRDKPTEDIDQYNGFWGVYGFRESDARRLYDFLIDSVERGGKKDHLLNELNPGVFYIDTYYDLGTVDSVAKFIGSDGY
ncbi:MAG: hypothetical protein ABFR36_10720 [Acidobacteriota bacterium]